MRALLNGCIKIEELVGTIYRELAVYPGVNPELREIWRNMASEEARHAERIHLLTERLETLGVQSLKLDPVELQALVDRAAEILQDVQDRRYTLDEAVYASVELEDAFMAVHLAYGAVQGFPDLQTLFLSLAEEDRKHVAALRSYLHGMHDGAGLVFENPTRSP